MTHRRSIIIALALVSASMSFAQSRPEAELPETLWLLVHPSNAPNGPGIYQWDTASGKVLKQLPLPSGNGGSPHALVHDGQHLWVNDNVTNRLYRIDPDDGDVQDVVENVLAEGLALAGDGLWVGDQRYLRCISPTGEVHNTIRFHNTIQDVTTDGRLLYIISNDSQDPIHSLNPTSNEVRVVTPTAVESLAPYALTWYRNQLLTVDHLDDNFIRHIDPASGDSIGLTATGVPGWITAIAIDPKVAVGVEEHY